VIEYVQGNRNPEDQFLIFDPAAVEFYAGPSLRGLAKEPDVHARVWFISIRAGYKSQTVSGREALDRLTTRRRQLKAIEKYGAVAYLFGPEE
jgi:hypothetical protein